MSLSWLWHWLPFNIRVQIVIKIIIAIVKFNSIFYLVYFIFFFGWLVYLECGAQVISHELLAIHKIQSRDICHLKSIFLFASQTHTYTPWHGTRNNSTLYSYFDFVLCPCDVREREEERKVPTNCCK